MDSKECKVSVICLAYNHEAYIRDALEGFVRQRTDFAYEVLVNDDASTDGTAAVIREYAEKYPEIIRPFYQEKNLYSQGIDIENAVLRPFVRGKYLAYCEGDDYLCDPEKLQLQADFLDAHPEYSACVHNSLGLVIGSGQEPAPLFPQTGDRDIPFSLIAKGMSHAFHNNSIMARSQWCWDLPEFYAVANRYGFGDYPFALWLAMNGKIRFLDRCMTVYRMRSNASSWSYGVHNDYDKFKRFVTGELEMFQALRPLLNEEQTAAADEEILLRRYELLEIEGRSAEQLKPPFDRVYRSKDAKYKLKHWIKRSFPRLHRLYRSRQGYGD